MHASILKVAGTVVGTAAVVISVSLGATHSSGSAAEPTPAISVAPADEPSAAPVLGQPVTTEAQAVAIAAQDLAMVRRVDSASAVLETLGALRAAGGVLEEQQQADYSDGASGVCNQAWQHTSRSPSAAHHPSAGSPPDNKPAGSLQLVVGGTAIQPRIQCRVIGYQALDLLAVIAAAEGDMNPGLLPI